jgi:hypothetical protein
MTLYKILFYLIYSFAAFFAIWIALSIDLKKKNFHGVINYISHGLIIIYALLFGLRDIDIGTDTSLYHYQYYNYEEIDFGTDAPVGLLIMLLNNFSKNPQVFLFLMSFLFLIVYSYSLWKYSDIQQSNFYLIVFSLISLFFFESLGINIIRQGVSIAFFILAIITHKIVPYQKYKWRFLLIMSVCFHFTSIIPILIYFLVISLKKVPINYFYYLYLISALLAAISFSILSFKDYFIGLLFIDERRSSYLIDDFLDYTVGFKPQFVVFNSIFLILFFYLNRIQNNVFYTNLLKYYALISAVFFMMFQIPYSDRWGIMSWCVIPLLIAPIFKVHDNRVSMNSTFIVLFLIFIFIFFQSR